MRITCLHGYFIIREDALGEVAKFNSYYGLDLVAKDDYYTFELLAGAPEYSQAALAFLDYPALTTYAGKPWEIMERNGLVYDFTLRSLRPVLSVTLLASITRTHSDWISRGLILPGSLLKDLSRIVGYQGGVDLSTFNYYYSEITYA